MWNFNFPAQLIRNWRELLAEAYSLRHLHSDNQRPAKGIREKLRMLGPLTVKPLFPFVRPKCVSLTLRAALILFFAVTAWAAQQPTQQPAQSTEVAKAAERKKRFEEQKTRLEEERSSSRIGAETEVSADQTLFVSPSVTNMLVGDTREFCVFDLDGRILTREAEWTIDDAGIAILNDKGQPTVITKHSGKTVLRARVGSRSAEASITVLDGDKMPNGTIKWSVPNYPGYKSKQIVQAVPTNRGPDIYTVEDNAQGKSLVRAWTSEGIILWIRKFDYQIAGAIPH
jgi:hypothetical protein